MKSGLKLIFGAQLLAAAVALAACSGLPASSTSTGGSGTGTGFTIGGAVTGLTGKGLVLQDNGGDDLTVNAAGPFAFPTAVTSAYAVTIKTQPSNPTQSCVITGGSGTATANVTSVAVACTTAATNATIGVTVTGLQTASGTTPLVLQDNGTDVLTISANGSYTFKQTVNGAYAVTVQNQPTSPNQLCTVTKSSGVATGNVTGIAVACASSYTVSGSVTGLIGTGLVLQDNGADNLTVTANGGFTFKTQLLDGAAYSVGVLTQPSGGQQCNATSNAGKIAAANIINVAIDCTSPTFTVGGQVLGLAGKTPNPPSQINLALTDNSFQIQNNLGNTLIIKHNGTFQFSTAEALNDQYHISVFHAPSSQPDNCWLWDYNGVVKAAVTDIVIDCGHNDWTWIEGSTSVGVENPSAPLYGTFAPTAPTSTPNPLTNTPGARESAATWIDSSGNLFLFGGRGYELSGGTPADQFVGGMNDMWVCVSFIDGCQWQLVGGYDPATAPAPFNTKGAVIQKNAQTEGQFGVYGTGPTAIPGGRFGAATWKDSTGNFWLFGGSTTDNHYLNDLWKYDPSSLGPGNYTLVEGTWTSVSGSAAQDQAGVYTGGTLVPGARVNAATWTDASGNFWMFGGSGYDGAGNIGFLNDLWEFNGTAWIWVSGGTTNVEGHNGNYGAQGVAAATNVPGARHEATTWTDANGNLWLFGGEGNDSVGTPFGFLNDLWMYNIASNKWTWVAGSNTANQLGDYPSQTVVGSFATTTAAGTCGLSVGLAPDCPAVPLTNAVPGARWGASSWIDAGGNLWLFGGWGWDSKRTDGNGSLNDLWVYTPNATPGQLGTWAWVKGSNTGAQTGVYDTVDTYPWPTLYTFTPGGRAKSAAWKDQSGQFWLFGGEGYGATASGFLNDMWRYVPYQ